MDKKMLVAALVAALLMTVSLAVAQSCSTCPTAGSVVRIAPDVRVVAVACPTGLVDGKSIIEYTNYRALENNRTLTMYVRPYPPGNMSEIAFTVKKSFNNFDSYSKVDVTIESPCVKNCISLNQMGLGKFCGHADFAPGWNTVNVWVTTPYSSELQSFTIWGGDLKDKPRQVNWMCPACRVTTIQTSCPVCNTSPCR